MTGASSLFAVANYQLRGSGSVHDVTHAAGGLRPILRITVSVGIAAYGADAPDVGTLLRAAGAAMAALTTEPPRCATRATLSLAQVGQSEAMPEVKDPSAEAGPSAEKDRTAVRAAVHRFDRPQAAASRRPLHAVYQPILVLATGEVAGYEALARFSDSGPGPLETFAAAWADWTGCW